MDGTPTSRLNDWMLRSLDAGKVPLGESARTASELPSVKALQFKLPQQVQSTITEAVSTHAETMGKHELAVLQYDGYGKDTIKSFKISPDSYTQLVMGLAYYKMTGHFAPTYESAQTRKFKLGRTEVIRSSTPDALEFYKAMEDPSKTDEERLLALQKAGAAHIKLAGEAADGKGVDRHLFGKFRKISLCRSAECSPLNFSLACLQGSRRCSRMARSCQRSTATRHSLNRTTGCCPPLN